VTDPSERVMANGALTATKVVKGRGALVPSEAAAIWVVPQRAEVDRGAARRVATPATDIPSTSTSTARWRRW
jgi:hypothetical protein